ncbi:NAD(P)H-dependent glycerol-3-phosphate dehydrogenase [Candidatus Hydrogenedentota bacterium]
MEDSVAILGCGSWGTALAILLANSGRKVRMWGPFEDEVELLREKREHTIRLPGVKIPDTVEVATDMVEVVEGATVLVLVVPSHVMRETARLVPLMEDVVPDVACFSKGLETDTMLRMSEVLAEELSPALAERLVIVSGPSHAEEVARGLPTVVSAASTNQEAALHVQQVFMTSRFRVYTNNDVVGVEIGAAIKNVMAIAAGISDGLGFGDNTKAALIARGLAEMQRLGIAVGGHPETFAGLSGVGDLIVTCASRHSRNRGLGERIGKGETLKDILASSVMVAEGVKTCQAVVKLAKKHGIEVPITEAVHRVLFEGLDPAEGVARLMGRDPKSEI